MKPLESYFALKFVKYLVTPFEEWEAFKLGVIDKNGNKLKDPSTDEEERSLSLIHILVKNIKKLLIKIPGFSSKIVSYATALFLLKENVDVCCFIDELCKEMKITLNENYEKKILKKGIYTVRHKEIFNDLLEYNNSFLFYVKSDIEPKFSSSGIDIFEVCDVVSNKKILLPFDIIEDVTTSNIPSNPVYPKNKRKENVLRKNMPFEIKEALIPKNADILKKMKIKGHEIRIYKGNKNFMVNISMWQKEKEFDSLSHAENWIETILPKIIDSHRR